MNRTTSYSETGRNTLVCVFDSRDQVERAIDELERLGFREDQIGFVMRGEHEPVSAAHTVETGKGAGEGAVEGAVAGGVLGGILGAAAALLLPGIGPVVAGGVLATALGGAAVGAAAGGILGALTSMGVPEEEARFYESEFQAGRAILTVHAGERWQEAADVLNRYGRCGQDARATDDRQTETARYGGAARPAGYGDSGMGDVNP